MRLVDDLARVGAPLLHVPTDGHLHGDVVDLVEEEHGHDPGQRLIAAHQALLTDPAVAGEDGAGVRHDHRLSNRVLEERDHLVCRRDLLELFQKAQPWVRVRVHPAGVDDAHGVGRAAAIPEVGGEVVRGRLDPELELLLVRLLHVLDQILRHPRHLGERDGHEVEHA